MRWVAAVLIGLAGACGGGDSAGPLTFASSRAPVAAQILRDCGADVIGAQLDTARAIAANFDPDQDETPRFVFTEAGGTGAKWTLDVDGDGSNEYAGTMTFADEFGIPGAPFDTAELITSSDRLPTFIAHIARGQVEVEYTSLVGTGAGTIRTTVKDGVANRLSGGGIVTAPGCVATFTFPGSATLLVGQPTIPVFFRLDLDFRRGNDTVYAVVTGGISTETVTVNTYVNDPARQGNGDKFIVNLATGVVD